MSAAVSIILISLLLLIVAICIIMMVLVYQKRQLLYIHEKKQMKANFEKEILESKLEIQEQTFKNISQEIHDNIGQMLSVIKLNVNTINGKEGSLALQDKVSNISNLLGKVIQDLRNLSKSLNSDIISERGLVEAIGYEFELIKNAGIFTTSLLVQGEPYSLPNQKELILFRVFQEVINNTIKHAQASMVNVCICFEPEKFVLRIEDNGKGFDMSNLKYDGIGLKNIKNRSQVIGASYSIDSQLGRGTHIRMELSMT